MTIIHIKLRHCLPDLDYHTRGVKIGHEVTAHHFITVKNTINLIDTHIHTQTHMHSMHNMCLCMYINNNYVCVCIRAESIVLFKLPIMLLSISPKIYLLCSILCSIMPNYAPLIVRNYLCLVLRLHIIIVICFLSEYLINYRAN